jgi:CarD family transcriptional regulator
MPARNKTKKTTKSKTKKAGLGSRAKSASRRAPKEPSESSARNRVGKRKSASNVRATRKAIRDKIKNNMTKSTKRARRRSSGTAARGQSAAKRPVKAAGRKVATSKSLNKATRSASVAKARPIARARSKEVEAKLRSKSKESRGTQESRLAAEKTVTPPAVVKPGFAEGNQAPFGSSELASPDKSAAPAIRVQKPAAPEEASSGAKSLKAAGQRQGFKLSEFVVYPAHGVGQIIGIEEQEVAGFKLELFVINFPKDKLTLRVPTSKVSGVGMRKISDPDTASRSLEILTGRARVKRTMWSRRAQEYETKINSGDINAIAEVVRDLYRSEAQPEQSYSERQLYEAALDRMVREIAAVQKSNEIDALKTVEAQLQKGQARASKSAGAQNAPGEIEQAA